MRKLLSSLFILWLGTATIFAQNDTISIESDDWSVIIGESGNSENVTVNIDFGSDCTKKNVYTRWFLMDLGFDILETGSNTPLITGMDGKSYDPLEMKVGKSMNVNIHIVQQRFNIIKHHLNLVYGLTIESHKYEFDTPLRPVEDSKPLMFEFLEGVDQDDLKKNRLTTTYLTVPLMFNFESNPSKISKSFHFTGGVYGGPLLGAHFKVKEKGEGKTKTKDNYNVNKWRYGVRSEIGYGPVTLYGQYAMNNLFDEDNDNGFEATPISIGLVLVPF